MAKLISKEKKCVEYEIRLNSRELSTILVGVSLAYMHHEEQAKRMGIPKCEMLTMDEKIMLFREIREMMQGDL